MNNPSFVNRTKTLPIGESDHDIIFNEINFTNSKTTPHKVYNIHKKADWDNIEQDLNSIYCHQNENHANMDIDDIWNYFKNQTEKTI
jgi:hypothetical protein